MDSFGDFLKLNHLHYGYWTDGLKVDIANVHIAQENYANFLISHIPKSAKKILDGDMSQIKSEFKNTLLRS